MPQLGATELIIILLAVLVLFGASQIPKFARNLGQGMKEFKKAARELSEDESEAPPKKDQPPSS